MKKKFGQGHGHAGKGGLADRMALFHFAHTEIAVAVVVDAKGNFAQVVEQLKASICKRRADVKETEGPGRSFYDLLFGCVEKAYALDCFFLYALYKFELAFFNDAKVRKEMEPLIINLRLALIF